MPTTAPPLPPLPPHDLPLVDLRTGRINENWIVWLKAVEQILRKVRSEIP